MANLSGREVQLVLEASLLLPRGSRSELHVLPFSPTCYLKVWKCERVKVWKFDSGNRSVLLVLPFSPMLLCQEPSILFQFLSPSSAVRKWFLLAFHHFLDVIDASFQIKFISWIIFINILCNITVIEITEGIYVYLGDSPEKIFSKYISVQ